jgi:hypothetical protein
MPERTVQGQSQAQQGGASALPSLDLPAIDFDDAFRLTSTDLLVAGAAIGLSWFGIRKAFSRGADGKLNLWTLLKTQVVGLLVLSGVLMITYFGPVGTPIPGLLATGAGIALMQQFNSYLCRPGKGGDVRSGLIKTQGVIGMVLIGGFGLLAAFNLAGVLHMG